MFGGSVFRQHSLWPRRLRHPLSRIQAAPAPLSNAPSNCPRDDLSVRGHRVAISSRRLIADDCVPLERLSPQRPRPLEDDAASPARVLRHFLCCTCWPRPPQHPPLRALCLHQPCRQHCDPLREVLLGHVWQRRWFSITPRHLRRTKRRRRIIIRRSTGTR